MQPWMVPVQDDSVILITLWSELHNQSKIGCIKAWAYWKRNSTEKPSYIAITELISVVAEKDIKALQFSAACKTHLFHWAVSFFEEVNMMIYHRLTLTTQANLCLAIFSHLTWGPTNISSVIGWQSFFCESGKSQTLHKGLHWKIFTSQTQTHQNYFKLQTPNQKLKKCTS